MKSIRIDHADNVAVVIAELRVGDQLGLTGVDVRAVEQIGRGHKVALADIRAGEKIIKYGVPIGHATVDMRAGSKVHTHNMKTDLRRRLSTHTNQAVIRRLPGITLTRQE
jgi:altronate hydrolase